MVGRRGSWRRWRTSRGLRRVGNILVSTRLRQASPHRPAATLCRYVALVREPVPRRPRVFPKFTHFTVGRRSAWLLGQSLRRCVALGLPGRLALRSPLRQVRLGTFVEPVAPPRRSIAAELPPLLHRCERESAGLSPACTRGSRSRSWGSPSLMRVPLTRSCLGVPAVPGGANRVRRTVVPCGVLGSMRGP